MVVKTTKGMYEIVKNVRDAFKKDVFENIYLEEYFDAYQYIVGDIASNTTRLKGFSQNPSNSNYFKYIPEYLAESCAYRGAYFILRRINETEYNTLYEKYKKHPNEYLTVGEEKEFTLEKKAFDKENLILSSSQTRKPHIVFDMNRINYIKAYTLPDDLKEDMASSNINKKNTNKEKVKNENNINKNNVTKEAIRQEPDNKNVSNQKQNGTSFNNNNNNKKAFSNNGGKKAFTNNKKNR